MEMMREQHRRSLAHCVAVVAAVGPDDLRRTTPCEGWDLAALLAHMVGQNEGFAVAVERAGPEPGGDPRGGEVGVEAFEPVAYTAESFAASVEHVAAAFAGAQDELVLLPEVSASRRIPVRFVLGMHLIDTLVHTWDVAASLGHPWHPEPDLAHAALEQALKVPPGSPAFAPALPGEGDDWERALRRLGRDPSQELDRERHPTVHAVPPS